MCVCVCLRERERQAVCLCACVYMCLYVSLCVCVCVCVRNRTCIHFCLYTQDILEGAFSVAHMHKYALTLQFLFFQALVLYFCFSIL